MLADDYESHFHRAISLLEAGPRLLETARTHLLYGERLRRDRHVARARAREQLRAALDGFEACGAEPWADRARAELRAAGGQPRARVRDAADELTPQEEQIAVAVAAGRSNREIASALFISPKTVEAHLTKVYRKLGVRSRSALAARMASAHRPSLAGYRAGSAFEPRIGKPLMPASVPDRRFPRRHTSP